MIIAFNDFPRKYSSVHPISINSLMPSVQSTKPYTNNLGSIHSLSKQVQVPKRLITDVDILKSNPKYKVNDILLNSFI